jgi:hypothetical protein
MAGSAMGPHILEAQKADSSVITGPPGWQFQVVHDWARLPAPFSWQTTHNLAVDRAQNVYIIHEGHVDKPDHPAIFVFDSSGKYIKSFGQQFQGGGHGLEIRDEGGQEFLYVTAYKHLKTFAKLDLDGEVVWQKYAPMKSGLYADGEDLHPENVGGRDRFLPTNFAFLPDGDFLLADGYGAWCIHRYSKDAEWQSKFGGPGAGAGTFDTPHGLWIDDRNPGDALIVVADRAHHTLQTFAMDGTYRETIKGFGLPANVDRHKNVLVVPELLGRVTILGPNFEKLAQLGNDFDRISADKQFEIRQDPKKWLPGKFVHPHDACFDAEGNVYVAEWVTTGRVTKLERLS